MFTGMFTPEQLTNIQTTVRDAKQVEEIILQVSETLRTIEISLDETQIGSFLYRVRNEALKQYDIGDITQICPSFKDVATVKIAKFEVDKTLRIPKSPEREKIIQSIIDIFEKHNIPIDSEKIQRFISQIVEKILLSTPQEYVNAPTTPKLIIQEPTSSIILPENITPTEYEYLTVDSADWEEFTLSGGIPGKVNPQGDITELISEHGTVQYFTQNAAIREAGMRLPDNEEWMQLLRDYNIDIQEIGKEYPDPSMHKLLRVLL